MPPTDNWIDRTFPIHPRWDKELEEAWWTCDELDLSVFGIGNPDIDGRGGNGSVLLMSYGEGLCIHHKWIELYLCP
jgi:hypothetical protein